MPRTDGATLERRYDPFAIAGREASTWSIIYGFTVHTYVYLSIRETLTSMDVPPFESFFPMLLLSFFFLSLYI